MGTSAPELRQLPAITRNRRPFPTPARPRHGGGAWADRAPTLWLAATLETPLFAASLAHPLVGSRTLFYFGLRRIPPSYPVSRLLLIHFHRRSRGGGRWRHLLAIVARGMVMTRITEGGR